jgi:prevent-host-death family protein
VEDSSVSTSDLKTHCSKIIDGVARKRQAVVVTKHGKAVAKIVPINDEAPVSIFGFASGCISVYGDILEPIETHWEAAEP